MENRLWVEQILMAPIRHLTPDIDVFIVGFSQHGCNAVVPHSLLMVYHSLAHFIFFLF